MEKKDLTAADVWAMFAETDRKMAETDRKMQENASQIAENDRQRADDRRFLTENLAETRRVLQENDRKLTEKFEKLGITVKDINSNVVGIGHSNGEYAEEYFFSSLKRKMEFAGVHFDDISTDFKRLKKAPDGRRIEDQFDIVMLNSEAVAII